MMLGAQLKDKGVAEAKRLLWIFGYFWGLLGLFALHKSIILHEPEPFYHQGFALVNALVLAKIVYLGEAIKLADGFEGKPLVYPTLLKSAVFTVALILSHLLEEVVVRAWRGEAVIGSGAAFPPLSLQEALAFGMVVFIALVPFFALSEIAGRVGGAKLFQEFFVRAGPKDRVKTSEQQEVHS